jgi:N-acetylglucosaminyldiphosphoundecaprenol N-acetyl-beta-D-mannosaminyltransferase
MLAPLPQPLSDDAEGTSPGPSNLSRSVYCILGMPIDAIDLPAVVQKIDAAAANRHHLRISTPNLNFLVSSLSDPEFRQSLLDSDLCPPDGTPILWIARLLGLPIRKRAAGSDLLELLKTRASDRKLKVFLFGGAEGVADAAARNINAQGGGLVCVGTLNPGFGEIDDMSHEPVIETVNSSGADFLILSLGAKKGQLWLQRNRSRVKIPVQSHLGAAISFNAGTVKRAPPLVRRWGLEWLWRIKEEKYLWARYRNDGIVFLRLLVTRVLPIAMISRRPRVPGGRLSIRQTHDDQVVVIDLLGPAVTDHVATAIAHFEVALGCNKNIVIDLSKTSQIDCRFLGLLLMLHKDLVGRGRTLTFQAAPPAIRRMFYLNELGSFLSPG